MGNKVRRDRPLGVTIIGVLLFLLGLFMILGGVTVGALVDLEGLDLAIEMVALVSCVLYGRSRCSFARFRCVPARIHGIA